MGDCSKGSKSLEAVITPERWEPNDPDSLPDAVDQFQGYQDDLLARMEALERVTDGLEARLGASEDLLAVVEKATSLLLTLAEAWGEEGVTDGEHGEGR